MSNISINNICSRVVSLSFLPIFLLTSVISLILWIQIKVHDQAEALIQLKSAASQAAKPIATELMINNHRGLNAILDELKRKYNFSNVAILNSPVNCNKKNSSIYNIFSKEICLDMEISEATPKKYILFKTSIYKTTEVSFLWLFLLVMLAPLLLSIMVIYNIKRKLKYSIALPLLELANNPENFDYRNKKIADELIQLSKKLSNYIQQRDEQKKQIDQLNFRASLADIVARVAHDIRSPLTAINTAVSNVPQIPENCRVMIKNASKRINDIANNLLAQSRNNLPLENNVEIDKTILPELIFLVIDQIVSEKRYEYYNSKIEIQLNIEKYAYNCFSKIHLSSFKRVLSNLINNSIEAINSNNGIVTITLKYNKNTIDIDIHDNGCGIPKKILHKVTENGFTYGKNSGAGIGLYYAKKHIEQLDGKILIDSKLNNGTNVLIQLLPSNPPNWFCESININKKDCIVVLDDDPSIHETWNEKFLQFTNINLIHFSNVSELTNKKLDAIKPTIYLVDFELIGNNLTGLDIIEEFNIAKNSILVTSCFEDIEIRNRCEKLGVKIIPKPYVPYIPINLFSIDQYNNDIILIDDDESMRIAWLFAAETKGKNISTFSSPDEVNKILNTINKHTVFYIDSELSTDLKGELYAKELYDKGFNNIYLTTGYPPSKFPNMPWIKEILGKDPPF